jgi:hypothetical protein
MRLLCALLAIFAASVACAQIPGDVNRDGKLDTSDAFLALEAHVGLKTLKPAQFTTADLNGDSNIALGEVVALLRASVGLGSLPVNLLLNPDFEARRGTPPDWSGDGRAEPSPDKPGLSLKISLANPGYTMVIQDVPVSGASSIRLSGWMRTEGMKPGSQPWEGARIFITLHDRSRRQVGGWPEVVTIRNDRPWRRYEATFQVPPDIMLVKVYLGLQQAAGTVWYDDLRLFALDKGGRYLMPTSNERTDTTGWFQFPGSKPQSPKSRVPIDVSFLQDAPAGKHGFLSVKNGHFVFEDGTRARFWGVNIVDGNVFRDHNTAAAVAERLAQSGCNMVRLHHMDASWSSPNIFDPRYKDTQHFSATSLDNLDFLIAELKKRGIYIYLDLLVHRKFNSGDDVRDWETLENGAKVAAHFNRRLIELQKKYAHDLLTHVNKYTGKAYIDEPAIAMMEIINESTLFWADGYSALPQSYQNEIRSLFEQWCASKGITPPAGSIQDLLRRRNRDVFAFLYELQTKNYLEIRDYLRSIGVKVPITGSNHWENWAADILSNVQLDYLDRHFYWDHPQGGYSPTNIFNNTPMIQNPLTSLVQLARQRVSGKPIIITEWNNCWINEYIAEAPVLVAAYACLQDWDGVLQFDFYGADWPLEMSSPFDIGNKPHVFGQWAAAALLFRRGDVATARQVIRGVLNEEKALTGVSAGADVPPWVPLVHRVELGEQATLPPPRSDTSWRSDTEELWWNPEPGVVTIDTSRTKALIGFTGGKEWKLGGVTIKPTTAFSAITVSSLDGSPIGQAKRLAVWAVARAENTGMVYNRARTSAVNPGHAPILVEPVSAVITLDGVPASSIEVKGVNPWGIPVGSVSVSGSGASATFKIGELPTIAYLIEIR